jgi:hypothetical protein
MEKGKLTQAFPGEVKGPKGFDPMGANSRCPDLTGSPSDTLETDILQDHCHIDNTPAPEAIETWMNKCRKLERERGEARREAEAWRAFARLNVAGNVPGKKKFPWENTKISGCEPTDNDKH